MNRKKILEKRMQRLMAKKAKLTQRALASNDAAEVRNINDELEDLNADIAEVQDEIDAIDDEAKGDGPTSNPNEGGEARAANVNPEQRGGNPMASYSQNPAPTSEKRESVLDSMEYRQAFANYVKTGDASGFSKIEARSDEVLVTTDVGKIIPNTIMNELIRTLKVYGQLYARVRKLNVKGGVEFPIEDLVPTVTWITETTVSETQSAPEIKTSVSFGYHICEARIAQSLLSQVVSLPVLEQEIARILAEAFVKEFDRMIISGTGSGQPTGITVDTRVPATHKIAFTAAELADWTKWRKKLFSIIPLAYRGQGVLVMTPNTWENYCMTLKDANNNPIGTETFNVQNGDTTCRFAGKEVILVESDILADFDTAQTNDTWGIYFKPTDYAINSNLQIGFKRYFNDDTNKWVNKGLCIVDGKLLDVNGVYLLRK